MLHPSPCVGAKIPAQVAPLLIRDSGINRRGYEREPGGPSKRVLYSVLAIIMGSSISFRLLVRGEDWLKPAWGNVLVLLLSFLLIAYGVHAFLDRAEALSK